MANSDLANSNLAKTRLHWRRRFWILAFVWLVVAAFSSCPLVRGLMIRPLLVHHPDATGEIAYVMAGGPAYWERLLAASDLYHREQIKEIYLLRELTPSAYNFVRQKKDSKFQRAIDFLSMRGVPESAVHGVVPRPDDLLSSRSEAQGLADLERRFRGIVVVTSPPHTRRSLLCFKRVFDDATPVSVYSATAVSHSVETHSPIWVEYAKLAVYYFLA